MPRQEEITPALLHAPVGELAALIKARRLSPVALTEAYLGRLEKVGPRLNAVVTVTRELALKEARDADADIRAGRYRGPLHGIPYGAKDLLATRGIPTTWGAEPYREQVFAYDATVIGKLRAAGAVLAAKLAMVELAGGFGYNNADASFTGPTRNPWNTDYWSGGSSSGSGAAVAAGLVAFAIGSETVGSIVTPASFCGLSGLRPTYGRVSRHGAMALCWTLDKLGPLCRTADDCGLVLSAIAGRDPLDPSSSTRPFRWPEVSGKAAPAGEGEADRPAGKYKVGVVKGATDRVQPEVKKNFEEALAVLRRFAEVEEGVELPDLPYSEVVGTILRAEGASAFRELYESGQAAKLRVVNQRWAGFAAAAVLAVDYLQAMRVREPMKRQLDQVYARYDAIAAPGRSTVAYPIGRDFDKIYPGMDGPGVALLLMACNLTGQPAVCVPTGFGARGLPTSVQFTGRAWGEARLLAVADAFQRATGWHKKHPPDKP